MTPLVELRVVSGPALGAVVELRAGRYTVGADDACDIVLAADSTVAGRHLALEIRQSAAGVEVAASPLDGGRVVLNGKELPEAGAAVPPGEALALGFSALAWHPCGETWTPITLVTLEFAQSLIQAKPQPPLPVTEEAAEPAEDTAAATPSAREDATLWAGMSTRWASLGTRRSGILILSLLAALLLALSLLVYTRTEASRATQVKALADEIERAGIKTVEVLAAEDRNALLLRGVVTDDRSLATLTRLASAQPLRTYLNVRVEDDALRAVRETLNAHDFYPEVSYESSGRLRLALYLKDRLTESSLLELGQDTPKILKASRKVAYAEDVAPLLNHELRALGLDAEGVSYLPGKVLLPYRLPPDTLRQLAEALARVRQRLGVPVVFQMNAGKLEHEVAAANHQGSNEMPDFTFSTTAEGKNAALGGLTVMSVTSGAIPFVTMSDRQTFFPGAVLPNGVSLVGIYADHLVLQKDQEIFTYSLKEIP